GHRDGLAHIVSFLRRRVGARAGFETMNLGHLLPRLASWDVTPDFVLGPMNPRGFCMKPSAQAVLDAIRQSPTPVIATALSARRTVAVNDAIAHARRHGAASMVLTLEELAAAGTSNAAPGNRGPTS